MSFFLPAPGGGGTEEWVGQSILGKVLTLCPDRQLKKGFLRLTSVSETTLPGVTVVTTCNINGDPGYVSTGCESITMPFSFKLIKSQGCSPKVLCHLSSRLQRGHLYLQCPNKEES